MVLRKVLNSSVISVRFFFLKILIIKLFLIIWRLYDKLSVDNFYILM